MEDHKSGYVNIVGQPNVGKSTLLNALMQQKVSIVTSKPQTTRHRIITLFNDEDFQIVFSDSPGVMVTPHYGMQESMNRFAYSSFEDADIILFVTDIYEKYSGDEKLLQALETVSCPKYLIINKIDQDKTDIAPSLVEEWNSKIHFDRSFLISAEQNVSVDAVFTAIINDLPLSPPYFSKEDISDRSERFFASEIIRESIFKNYKQEVPYSTEVVVHAFKEDRESAQPLLKIYADIYVDRKSQKPILIGKNGQSIKKLGIAAREGLEKFFEIHVFLDLKVKIKENWRDDKQLLSHFGYDQ
ncbi:MAG: GTPase Era [Lewinellaceae bacterium]|nr:GTPase Era [Lewinellaceae bacterium]